MSLPISLRAVRDAPATRLARGDVLFHEGDPANHFFVVETGTFEVVRLAEGRSARVSTFGPGEFGGEVPLLLGTDHLATGRASSDALLRVLDANDFWILLGSSPDARSCVLDNMALRADELRQSSLEHEILMALRRVTSGVAHELLNPLNFVIGFAEVAHERLTEAGPYPSAPVLAEVLESLLHVRSHGERASATVVRMRAHVEALQSTKGEVDLAELATQAVARLDAPGVEVSVVSDAELPVVRAAGAALSLVLQGLLDNAVHAIRARVSDDVQGHVGVRIAAAPGTVEVTVSDNGVGIAPDRLGRVFEPFYTTRAGTEGSGLGLAIAYDVVTAAHGGSIQIDSTEGQGSTVTIHLPTPHARA